MTILAIDNLSLEFLLNEVQPGTLSRDQVLLTGASGVLQAGTVLAKSTATGKYVPAVATATDGTQNAVAILGYKTDTTAGDAPSVAITGLAEVVASMLVYDTSVNTPTLVAAKIAQLAAVFIKAR